MQQRIVLFFASAKVRLIYDRKKAQAAVGVDDALFIRQPVGWVKPIGKLMGFTHPTGSMART
ncbi:hypothetical protein DNK06_18635 [Pseudomonas daroniae]|uniref:Uncharacterized protein n=1 Tax=Phytopseudomonas daroniae TaxID=2487519 RepID=A0A4Q9QHK8_9GAMM|nr:hypothetical protein DNK06_18635 [Pseudomonas daroniae]TBU79975.1 hypothetical protein DNK31_18415 [Pseudomonas sp. FRB 228]TBU88891.1 hypothetical protein DNJ99_17805 [Pseudomonas daroniae]